MKPKIAFFVTDLNSGGIENYLLRFLTFYQHRVEATVYCKAGRRGLLAVQFENIGVRVKPFTLGYYNIRQFIKLKKELKVNSYHSVVDFTGNFAGITLYLVQKAGITGRIAFYRSSSLRYKKNFIKTIYDRFVRALTHKYATAILFNSKAAVFFFYPEPSCRDGRFKVIYNGIDAAAFLSTNDNLRAETGIPEESFVVGHVGRYNTAKNHDTIIAVARIMCHADQNVRFLLCGKDVPVKLKQQLQDYRLTDKVITLDNRQDVIRVLNSMDCFYFPSITEGQPNALIEAIIAGLPFVASDIENIKEILPEAYHQWLVPAMDINASVKKITDIRKNNHEFTLKEQVIKKFSHQYWFRQFFEEIIK